jgi:thioredoxin 1
MAEGNTINVTDAEFESVVLQSDVLVLVDFWAPWCGPCKMAAPALEKIAGEYEGKLKVCKVNVDEERQVASQHGIMSIPTMYLFKNGQVVDQVTGVTPSFEADLKKKIDAQLG